jgi:hypothetical protein
LEIILELQKHFVLTGSRLGWLKAVSFRLENGQEGSDGKGDESLHDFFLKVRYTLLI